MTDIEIIKAIEKVLKEKLARRDPGDIEDILRRGKPAYCLDETGAVIGLNLAGRSIKPAVPYLARLTHLTHLSLNGCKLKRGDLDFLAGLDRLTHLNLGGNPGIGDYSFLKALKGLKRLYLEWNNLTEVSFLVGLPGLTELSLSGNPGISDYSFLGALKGLKKLYLWENNLTNVSFLGLVPGLTELYLGWNNLTDISFLRLLPGLETLYLVDNKITDLSFVAHLDQLTELEFRENPIENPPPEIANQGVDAIRDYFRSLKEGSEKKLDEVKILLVGEGSAGKTSLFKRLNGEPFNENEGQTHGVNIGTLPIDVLLNGRKQTIKAHCWDFGGQEIMHATHQFFLSSRSLYILVLDSRKDDKTDYWLKHIASFGGHSPVLIVINKIDVNPGFDLDRNSLKEKYANIEGFYRVSCKNKSGLEAFKQALQGAIPGIELLRTPVAASWLHVKEKLQTATAKDNYLDQPAFEMICEQEKITDASSRTTLIRFLNELGVVLHFKELALSNFHVLNPRWVTEAVYRIINSPFLAGQKGILDTGRLPFVLNEEKTKTEAYEQKLPGVTYKNPEQLYILSLMENFKLCFRLDNGKILIPDLLEKETPRIDIDGRDALRYVVQYDFLPGSVISRFMVRMHRDIEGNCLWRTGVVLQDRDLGVRALVKADENERQISILVSGKQKRDYFSVIRKTIREINGSFLKFLPKELVPLPGYTDEFVDYRELIGHEQMGEYQITIGRLGKKFPVKQLLDGIESEQERREHFPGNEGGFHFHGRDIIIGDRIEEVNKMPKTVMNIGKGATIENMVAADVIQGSFNKIGSSGASDELKMLLEGLTREVERMAGELEKDRAEELAKDLQTFIGEAISKNPRKKWWQLSAEGIKEAAKTVGEIGLSALKNLDKIIPVLEKLSVLSS